MIRKTSSGYVVRAESGRNLSKPNLSKSEAEDRLSEIEKFKHMDKWAKRVSKGGKR